MHNGVKKYSCEFCQKSFNKRNTLNNHKRLHTGNLDNCCQCGSLLVTVQGRNPSCVPRRAVECPLFRELLARLTPRRDTASLSLSILATQTVLLRVKQVLPRYCHYHRVTVSLLCLSQLSASQRLEQQQLEERLRQHQPQPQQQHLQHQYVGGTIISNPQHTPVTISSIQVLSIFCQPLTSFSCLPCSYHGVN